MNRASRHIYNWLYNRVGSYTNPQGINFFVNKDGSTIVSHMIKDHALENVLLFGLSYSSNNFNDFIRDFGFTGTHQLKALSVDCLWEMYYKGQVKIYCSVLIVVIYGLLFSRVDNKMFVKDGRGYKYELDEILQTPTQFAAYTWQQAMLHRR